MALSLLSTDNVCEIMQRCSDADNVRLSCTCKHMRQQYKAFRSRMNRPLPDICLLSFEQHKVACAVIDKRRSIFLMGDAGSGKSFTFNAIKRHLESRRRAVLACAPTGVAAQHICGYTIHQVFGFTIDNPVVFKHGWTLRSLLQTTPVLMLDEVSMLSADLFVAMDRRLRELRHQDVPFGGVQLVMCCDPFQLPPVSTVPGKKEQFCFENPLFLQMIEDGGVFVLRDSKRHENDPQFCGLLNNLRFGSLSVADTELLKRRLVTAAPEDYMHLFCRRDPATVHNTQRLSSLPTPLHTWTSVDVAISDEARKMLSTSSVLEEQLNLKVGAPVLLRVNFSTFDHLVNGTRGVVIAIKRTCELGMSKCPPEQACIICSEPGWTLPPLQYRQVVMPRPSHNFIVDTNLFSLRPLVLFSGQTQPMIVAPFYFAIHVPRQSRRPAMQQPHPKRRGALMSFAEDEPASAGEVIAMRVQFPLLLAYALTIHRAQGMTLDKIALPDLHCAFDDGQVYVAVSRARTLSSVLIVGQYVPIRSIRVSQAAVKFWERYAGSIQTHAMVSSSSDVDFAEFF